MDSHSLHHTILCITILFLLPLRHWSVVTTFVAGNGVVLLLENRHSSFHSNNHDGRTVHHKLLEKGAGLQADNPPIHPIDGSILPTIPQNSIHDPINACVYLATARVGVGFLADRLERSSEPKAHEKCTH